MNKEELIKKIKDFLDKSPFEDIEVNFWQEKIKKMNETDLLELLNLLQEKLKILTQSNQLLINISDEMVKEQEKENLVLPKKINLINLPIGELSKIIRKNLVNYLTDNNIDFISVLDKYFEESFDNKEKVADEFDKLIEAITNNNELLDANVKITIGQWLKFYNQFNDSNYRKNIDRINFINKNAEVNKLKQESKAILLNLLRLYDYLLDPNNVILTFENNRKKSPNRKAAPTEKPQNKNISEKEVQLNELKQLLAQYPAGTIERKAVEEEIKKLEAKN